MANKSYIVEKTLPTTKKTGRPKKFDSGLWQVFLKVLRKAKKNVEKFLSSIQLFVKCIDTARGGKITKIHVLIDENFHLVKFLLSGGNVNDNLVALPLLQGLNLKDKAVLADKAYSTAKIRDYLEKQGAVVCR